MPPRDGDGVALALLRRVMEERPRKRKIVVEVPIAIATDLRDCAELLRRDGEKRRPLGRVIAAALRLGLPAIQQAAQALVTEREQDDERARFLAASATRKPPARRRREVQHG